MRFLLVFIALSLVTISSGSEETDALHKAEYLRLVKAGESGKARLYIEAAYPQWDLKKMRGLCMFVSSREEEDNPVGRFKWTYQALILQVSATVQNRICCLFKTGQFVRGRKSLELWARRPLEGDPRSRISRLDDVRW
jgi:hypothetical protein